MTKDPGEHMQLIRRMRSWLTASQAGTGTGVDEVEVLGSAFLVLPGVFSPRYYSETEFFASQLVPRLRAGSRFLDIGCGVGVNTVLAALKGLTVTAVDINPVAVENTVRNLRRHHVVRDVDVRVSDIFSALEPSAQFDAIYWNVPFTYRNSDAVLTPLEEAIFDPGFRKLRTFVEQSTKHLSNRGEVFLGASPTLGEPAVLSEVCAAAGFEVEVLAEAFELHPPEPVVLELRRLTRPAVR